MFEWINEPHRPRATPMYACKQTAEKKKTNCIAVQMTCSMLLNNIDAEKNENEKFKSIKSKTYTNILIGRAVRGAFFCGVWPVRVATVPCQLRNSSYAPRFAAAWLHRIILYIELDWFWFGRFANTVVATATFDRSASEYFWIFPKL